MSCAPQPLPVTTRPGRPRLLAADFGGGSLAEHLDPPGEAVSWLLGGSRNFAEADPSRSETVRGVAEAAASSSMRSCVDRRGRGPRGPQCPWRQDCRDPGRAFWLQASAATPTGRAPPTIVWRATCPPIKVAGRACEPGRQSLTRKSAEGFCPLLHLECTAPCGRQGAAAKGPTRGCGRAGGDGPFVNSTAAGKPRKTTRGPISAEEPRSATAALPRANIYGPGGTRAPAQHVTRA